METPPRGFRRDLDASECVADIDNADFVALRCGEAVELKKIDARRLNKSCYDFDAYVETATSCTPLSVGFCCGRWNEIDGLWDLRAHEVDLWPGGWPAGAAISEASYSSLASAPICSQEKRRVGSAATWAGGGRWSSQLAASAQWVFAALRKRAVPIIVHDGLPEILQVCDKFLACGIPHDPAKLGLAWLEVFPMLFDTRVLTQKNKKDPLLEWEKLRAYLDEKLSSKLRRPFQEGGPLWKRRTTEKLGVYGRRGEYAVARDAMVIAEVFLLEMIHHYIPIEKISVASIPTPMHSSSLRQASVPTTPAKRGLKRSLSQEESPKIPLRKGLCQDLRHASSDQEAPPFPVCISPSSLFSNNGCAPFCNHVAVMSSSGRVHLCDALRRPADDTEIQAPVHDANSLRSIARALGAKEDSTGRLVLTPSMAKGLKKALLRNAKATQRRSAAIGVRAGGMEDAIPN